MGLISWFKSLFGKIGSIIKKGWALSSPFLKEFLSASAAQVLSQLQTLAVTAVAQIASQGLPTDDAKRKAFADYMSAATKKAGIQLKDYEINLLRETAVAIYKQSLAQA